MDKNQSIGIVLLLIIAAGYFWLSPKQDLENKKAEITEQVIEETNSNTPIVPATKESTAIVAPLDSVQQVQIQLQNQTQFGLFSTSAQGENQEIELKNSKLSVKINSKGGLFHRATLTDGYTQFWGKSAIELWDAENSTMDMTFDYSGRGKFSTKDFYFTPSTTSSTASVNGAASVSMRLQTNDPNKYIEYRYTLVEDSYEVKFDFQIVGLDGVIDSNTNPVKLNWNLTGNHNEKGIEDERRYSSVFFREKGENRDYLSEGREDEEILATEIEWVSFKQKFFSAMVINEEGFKTGSILENHPPEGDKDTTFNMSYSAQLPLKVKNFSNSSTNLRFYFGPNEFNNLKALQIDEVTRIIDYGPSIIGWVNRHIVRPMFFFFSKYISSVGIVILILTLVIKMALFPVTWKNYLSSAKMRVLKPQIEEINKKFEGKDKAMEKQQATMALYRQTGVNPFAGCIPVLFQMPILYAMFRFFPASIELRGESFLWADDLSSYDEIFSWSQQIPLLSSIYGNHISLFTLLMAASTFVYTRMNSSNMPTQSQPGMPDMKMIMNFFPIMMLFFFNKFSSALSLYYFAANLVSISQMWSIKKWFVNEDKILAKMEEKKKNPKKKSNFQQKLEEMQKQQQTDKKKKKK